MKKRNCIYASLACILSICILCACSGKGGAPPEEIAQIAAAAPVAAETENQTAGTETAEAAPDNETAQMSTTAAEDTDNPSICTLCISCATILPNIDKLDPDKRGLVPEDGVIYYSDAVEFDEGETVFDILLRETRREKIHFEFASAPAFNSVYIEGINNIYEFDCGELSGWTYKVNGEVLGYGCSLYALSPGDEVEIVYTCDLGADVGGNF